MISEQFVNSPHCFGKGYWGKNFSKHLFEYIQKDKLHSEASTTCVLLDLYINYAMVVDKLTHVDGVSFEERIATTFSVDISIVLQLYQDVSK
jgi:hypothetical protein